MKYTTPELIVLGPASVLVLGSDIGVLDSAFPETRRPDDDITLGLDD